MKPVECQNPSISSFGVHILNHERKKRKQTTKSKHRGKMYNVNTSLQSFYSTEVWVAKSGWPQNVHGLNLATGLGTKPHRLLARVPGLNLTTGLSNKPHRGRHSSVGSRQVSPSFSNATSMIVLNHPEQQDCPTDESEPDTVASTLSWGQQHSESLAGALSTPVLQPPSAATRSCP